MSDFWPALISGIATLVPMVVAFWACRAVRRSRFAAAAGRPLGCREAVIREWLSRSGRDPETALEVRAGASPAQAFYEWLWVCPELASYLRVRRPLAPETALEDLLRDAWAGLPTPLREEARARLLRAVRTAASWWGGAEEGWNRRPFVALATSMRARDASPRLMAVPDLSAAPEPLLADAGDWLGEKEGWELALFLVLLRRASPAWTHPLSPRQDSRTSLVADLSVRLGSEVGRKVGSGLGGALGPIGAMVGGFLGERAGRLGAQAAAREGLPAPLAGALGEVESALASLGELCLRPEFVTAASAPERAVIAFGSQVEGLRAARSHRFGERFWPSAGLLMVERALYRAADDLRDLRRASERFCALAREASPVEAGAMILQNPWLAAGVPEGPDRLTRAREALNVAAVTARRLRAPSAAIPPSRPMPRRRGSSA